MKNPHHQHPETALAVNWIAALLNGTYLPDLSKKLKPASAARKEVCHA